MQTLNSNPDNNRGYRATLLLLDESNFCSNNLIEVVLPFLSQDSDFEMGVTDIENDNKDENIGDPRAKKKNKPNRVIFSSSAGSTESMHYQTYREYGKEMLMGNLNYFVADIPCDEPLRPMKNGRYITPLLKQSDVDNAMRVNPEKAKREYYNKFEIDGGSSQTFRRSSIQRNETFYKPILCNNPESTDLFAMAFDPARMRDNSIVTVMRVIHDEQVGWYGEIVNSVNLIELGKKKKTPMTMPKQIEGIHNMLLEYNGQTAEYENIDAFLIDAGAGGGGVNYGDNLRYDFTDTAGNKHYGIMDRDYKVYQEDSHLFPNARNIVKMIDPKAEKDKMIGELIELLSLDLIKFPKSYNGKKFITIPILDEDGIVADTEEVSLTLDEQVSLINMDILKEEMVIWRTVRQGEVTKYVKTDEKKDMHDDRFYTLLLLARYLYEKRRSDKISGIKKPKRNIREYFASN